MRALRICRRCLEHLAKAYVRGATATSQLRSSLIPMADARKRRGMRTVERLNPGSGRGCATALSSALGVRMYTAPESQAIRSLRIGGSLGRAVLTAHSMRFDSAVAAAQ